MRRERIRRRRMFSTRGNPFTDSFVVDLYRTLIPHLE
jgi:hypothetical protein